MYTNVIYTFLLVTQLNKLIWFSLVSYYNFFLFDLSCIVNYNYNSLEIKISNILVNVCHYTRPQKGKFMINGLP